MIDLTIDKKVVKRNAQIAGSRGVTIPTFAQMIDHHAIPESVKEELRDIGMWDMHPRNLYRIGWHNEAVDHGGGFGLPNFVEFPSEITGVDARIIALIGKWFPTGAHKVGAAFGCLVPRLVTGQFDLANQKSVWPSTGNYCRGGAYDAALLGCESIAILPEGMSKERFKWLEGVAGNVIKTPGSESNVKEIFDKCWELRESGENLMIFNQFEELGNYLWHYTVTGPAFVEVADKMEIDEDDVKGFVCSTGSAGTIATGDYLKDRWKRMLIGASEALQCPTLSNNGYGSHRIEGIGDKHVPWIHNVRNTDMVIAIDDVKVMNVARLFNDKAGLGAIEKLGVNQAFLDGLNQAGISGISNMMAAIKMAKWYEYDSDDVIFTVLTDGMELYNSRLDEMSAEYGPLSENGAEIIYHRDLMGLSKDNVSELDYYDKKRIHNLKYFTWVEQQGRDVEELDRQWCDKTYWTGAMETACELDSLITEFNEYSKNGDV
ncbi:MAG: pyridoxal-5-phosphate-dependent protein subunit beta [Euryarchaeota archaeon]|nr:pyridoxal-5-phosphate-dependent protein subunit beta [Euryarchaeota archaeon]|tara:strand:- start:2130 stop:3596 length:1467 start_codon:yes stop_codon:yes gene_type:complete